MTARTVAVTGTGQTTAVPDVLRLQIGVAATAPDVSSAMTRAADSMTAVIDALLAAGVQRTDLATSSLSVRQEHSRDRDPDEPSYEVSDSLTVTLRNVAAAGDAIAAAVAAGGNDIRIHGASPEVSDPAAAAVVARDAAFADAHAIAEQYARLAGARLGEVLSVSEGGSRPSPTPRMATFSASMPVEAGTAQVSVSVDVVFELV